jgi:hypothetical protein
VIYRIGKVLLLGITVTALTGLFGCGGTNQDQTTEPVDQSQTPADDDTSQTIDQTDQAISGDNLLTTDPGTLTADIKEGLELAQNKAKEWQSNAMLTAVQIEIPGSLKKTHLSTRYIFSSTSTSYYYWTIALTSGNENYVRALVPKEDYISTDLKVILPQFWKYNYLEALQIAEQGGGANWRKTHNLGGVKMILSRGQPQGWLYWQVEYIAVGPDDERRPTENLKVKFNAYTGEITTE